MFGTRCKLRIASQPHTGGIVRQRKVVDGRGLEFAFKSLQRFR